MRPEVLPDVPVLNGETVPFSCAAAVDTPSASRKIQLKVLAGRINSSSPNWRPQRRPAVDLHASMKLWRGCLVLPAKSPPRGERGGLDRGRYQYPAWPPAFVPGALLEVRFLWVAAARA